MKKILTTLMLSSLIITNAFSINVNIVKDIKLKKIPIENHFLSTENGGNKQAIDAYSDGIGIYTTGLDNLSSYSAMNELVFKYGEEAKNNESSLKDFVQNNGNSKEQDLANLLGNNTNLTEIGATCDDGNINTINDIYIDTNGTCKGTLANVKSSIKCYGELPGTSIIVNGVSYLVVTDLTIKSFIYRADTLCTSNVTNMSELFAHQTNFNKDISHWDVSNVTNMFAMFFWAEYFNQDISNWDVSNVTNMASMFDHAFSFNQDISNWNVSNVISFSQMFDTAVFFNQPIQKWNINFDNLWGIDRILSNAMSFNQNLSSWTFKFCNPYFAYINDYMEQHPELSPTLDMSGCGGGGPF